MKKYLLLIGLLLFQLSLVFLLDPIADISGAAINFPIVEVAFSSILGRLLLLLSLS